MTLRHRIFQTAAALLLLFCMAAPAWSQTYREVTTSIWVQGFDEGSPCILDIDGDGLFDMLLGTARGNIRLYEQRSAGSLEFELRESNFLKKFGYDSESRPEAMDLDNDGLIDLLVGCNDGRLAHYEQATARSYDFRLRVWKFNNIDVGAHSGCSVADIDGDGRLELIATESSSPIFAYRQNAPGDTLFTAITTPALPRTGAYPDFLLRDIDGDGLFDILVSDEEQALQQWRQAAAASDSFVVVSSSFLGLKECRRMAMECIDINGDGLKELFLAHATGRIEVRRQSAANSMDFSTVLTTNLLGSAENGFEGSTTVGDIDGDGLIDLVTSMPTYYGPPRSLVRHEQTAPNSTDFAFADSITGVQCTRFYFPSLMDIDGNGRMDILLGTKSATVERYEQISPGSSAFALTSPMVSGIDLMGNSVQCSAADIDDDGLLDLFLAVSGGAIHHYRQTAVHDTGFVPVSSSLPGVAYSTYPHVCLLKDAGTGLFNLYLGTYYSTMYRYTQEALHSSSFSHQVVSWAGITSYSGMQPNFADVNGDGLPDLILGDQGCGFSLYLAEPETGSDPLPERNGALGASCYPNPCASQTVITVRGEADAAVTLTIHDMLGREAYSSAATMSPSGQRSFTIDGSRLAPGSYLYVARSGAARVSGVMIKQ